MHITRPNAQDPTPEETRELEQFKHLIEVVAADGVITYEEVQILHYYTYRQGTTTADQLYRELELYRHLITEKVQSGELVTETLLSLSCWRTQGDRR